MISHDAALRNEPIDSFTKVEGSRRPCRRQNATMKGVKAKIISGLNA